MKKKSLLLFLLVAIVSLWLMGSTAAYAADPTVTVTSVTAKPGDTNVYVYVNLANNPGIKGFKLTVNYDDSVLTPLVDANVRFNHGATSFYSILYDQDAESLIGNRVLNTTVSGKLIVTWANSAAVTPDGSLFRIAFSVKSDAAGGTYPITIVNDDTVLPMTTVNGYVTVKGSLYLDGASPIEKTATYATTPEWEIALQSVTYQFTDVNATIYSDSECGTVSEYFGLTGPIITSALSQYNWFYKIKPSAANPPEVGDNYAWIKVTWNDGADHTLVIPVIVTITPATVAQVTAGYYSKIDNDDGGFRLFWTAPTNNSGIASYKVEIFDKNTEVKAYETIVSAPANTCAIPARVKDGDSNRIIPGTSYVAKITSIADASGNYVDSARYEGISGFATAGKPSPTINIANRDVTITYNGEALPASSLGVTLGNRENYNPTLLTPTYNISDKTADVSYYYVRQEQYRGTINSNFTSDSAPNRYGHEDDDAWLPGLPKDFSIMGYYVLAVYKGTGDSNYGVAYSGTDKNAAAGTVSEIAKVFIDRAIPILHADDAVVAYKGSRITYPDDKWSVTGVKGESLKSLYTYNGDDQNFNWYYRAVADGETEPPATSDTGWSLGTPINAGDYWVYCSIGTWDSGNHTYVGCSVGNYTTGPAKLDSNVARVTVNPADWTSISAAHPVTLTATPGATADDPASLTASWSWAADGTIPYITNQGYTVSIYQAPYTVGAEPVATSGDLAKTVNSYAFNIKKNAADTAPLTPGTEYVAILSLRPSNPENYLGLTTQSAEVEAPKYDNGVLDYTVSGWIYAATPLAIAPTFNGTAISGYTIAYEYKNPANGDAYEATTLANSGAEADDGQPKYAGDYQVTVSYGDDYYAAKSVTKQFTIAQLATGTLVTNGVSGSMSVPSAGRQPAGAACTYDLSKLIQGQDGMVDVVYSAPTVGTDASGLIAASPALAITDGQLAFSVNAKPADTTATLTVTIASRNYASFTGTLTLTAKDKQTLTLLVTDAMANQFDNPSNASYDYDGNAKGFVVTDPIYRLAGVAPDPAPTGSLAYTYQAWKGIAWALTDAAYGGVLTSGAAPIDAGSYRAVVTLEDDEYQLATFTYEFTINKLDGAITFNTEGTVYPQAPTYTSEPLAAPAADTYTKSGTGAVSFLYYTDPACTALYDGDGKAPTNAGRYYLQATVAPSTNYREAKSNPYLVTIGTVPLTIKGVAYQQVWKTYDGSTAAPTGVIIENNVIDLTYTQYYEFEGVIAGDDVKLTATDGSYAKADAGTCLFTFTGLGLYGADAVNYTLGDKTTYPMGGTIRTKGVTFTWSAVAPGDFTYTGSEQSLIATYTDIDGKTVNADMNYTGTSGAATGDTVFKDAGNYQVVATITDPNYVLGADTSTLKSNSPYTYTIKPLPVTPAKTTAVLTKEYDGGTALPDSIATLGVVNSDYYTLTGKVAADDLVLKATGGQYDAAAVGTRTATLSSLSLGGAAADNYVLATGVTTLALNGQIDAKTVDLTWSTTDSYEYSGSDQSASITATYTDLSGTSQNATLSFLGTSGAASGDDVFKEAGAYTVTASIPANYAINGTASQTYTITPASLTPVATAGQTVTKTFDGNTTVPAAASLLDENSVVSATYYSFPGLISGDSVTLKATGAAYINANAGTPSVSLSGLSLSGTAAGNYTLANTSLSLAGQIKTKAVALTWSAAAPGSFTYDRTSKTLTASYTDVNGANQNAGLTFLGTSGAANTLTTFQKAGNYNVTATVPANYCIGTTDGGTTTTSTQVYTIAQRTVTPNSTSTAVAKVYDGTTAAPTSVLAADGTVSTTYVTLSDVAAGDTVTLKAASGAFTGANVNNSGVFTFSILSLGGADKDNYKLNQTAWFSTVNCRITAKPVSVTWSTPAGYEYNGSDQSSKITAKYTDVNGTAQDATVAISQNGSAATYKAVGSYLATASTTDTNYQLTGNTKTYTIDGIPLTVDRTSYGVVKTYDGTTALPAGVIAADGTLGSTYYTFTGLHSGDDVTLKVSGTIAYASADAGDPSVTLPTLTLAGTDAGNYSLNTASLVLNGRIMTKAVGLSFITATSYTYGDNDQSVTATYTDVNGATANAAISYLGTSGAASGDTAFADAGNYTVTATVPANYCSGATDGGTDRDDTLNVAIDPRPLTLAKQAAAVSKTYDGNTGLPLGILTATVLNSAYYTLNNAVSGDSLTVTATAGAYDDANVGTPAVNLTGVALGGTDAANYSLAATTLALNGQISAKSVTLAWATPTSREYNVADQGAEITATYQDVAGNKQNATIAFLGTSGLAKDATVYRNVGAYTATASITDTNYTLSNATQNYTITAAPLTVSAKAAVPVISKVYDGTTALPAGFLPADKTLDDAYYEFSGLKGSDIFTLQVSGSYVSANAGTPSVTLTDLTPVGSTVGNYSFTTDSLTLAGEIITKGVALTWTPTAPGGFTYDGSAKTVTATFPAVGGSNAPASVSYLGQTGLASGDTAMRDAGDYQVTATLPANYSYLTDGSSVNQAQQTYTVAPLDLSANTTVTAQFPALTYNGSAQTPLPTVSLGSAPLTKGTEYDFAATDYSNNINAGAASLTINFQGNYTGSKTVGFTIGQADVSTMGSASLTGSAAVLEPGKTMTAAVSGTLPAGNWTWYKDGVSFTNASAIYTVAAGDEGKEFYAVYTPADTVNYTGSLTTNSLIAGQANLSFDEFSINISQGTAAGDTVTANIVGGPAANNYTLTWYVAGNKVAEGNSYTLTDADKGKLVTLVATAAGDTYKGSVNASASFSVDATVPGAPTVTAQGDKGQVTVNWTEAEYGGSPIQGYIITITNSHETETQTVSSGLRSYTFTDLRPGEHYTVEVSAFNAVGQGPKGTATADTPSVSVAAGFGTIESRALTVAARNGSASVSAADLTNIAKLRVTAVIERETTWLEMDGAFLRGLNIDKELRVVLTQLNPIPVIGNYAYSQLITAVKVAIYVDGVQIENFNRSFNLLVGYEAPSGLNTANLSLVHFADDGQGQAVAGSAYVADEPGVLGLANSTSFFAIVNASAPAIQFNDVPTDRWSAEYIYYLAERGIVGGIGNDLFDPTANVTRAQFVKMLAGVAGADLSAYTGNGGFSDVSTADWFAPYVVWAVENGVTKGVGDNLFAPQAGITRQEMATMIYRYIQKTGASLPQSAAAVTFADNSSIAAWAADAVAAMQQAGIINGVGDNSFAPLDNTTREAAAKMLAVTHQLLNK